MIAILFKAGYNVRFLNHVLNIPFSKRYKLYVNRMVFYSYV